MDADIHNLRKKQAYERAKYMNEDYVQDRSFRLRFLRCDRFHSELAAQRMVQHFKIKQDLFGNGPVLARDVLLSDLSPEDILALESGYIQVLPVRDVAGRSIFWVTAMNRPDTCSIENCVSRKEGMIAHAFICDISHFYLVVSSTRTVPRGTSSIQR